MFEHVAVIIEQTKDSENPIAAAHTAHHDSLLGETIESFARSSFDSDRIFILSLSENCRRKHPMHLVDSRRLVGSLLVSDVVRLLLSMSLAESQVVQYYDN